MAMWAVDAVARREGTGGRGHATPGSHFCLFEARSAHSCLAARFLPRPRTKTRQTVGQLDDPPGKPAVSKPLPAPCGSCYHHPCLLLGHQSVNLLWVMGPNSLAMGLLFADSKPRSRDVAFEAEYGAPGEQARLQEHKEGPAS